MLDEEIRQAEADHKAAEDHYVQTQIAIQDQHFPGLTGEKALAQVHKDLDQHRCLSAGRKKALWAKLLPLLGLLAAAGGGAFGYFGQGQPVGLPLAAGAAVFVLTPIVSSVCRSKARGLKTGEKKFWPAMGSMTQTLCCPWRRTIRPAAGLPTRQPNS
ncbi:MAG: hypothetical protein V8S34_04935 [Lawsonibacter sp.]